MPVIIKPDAISVEQLLQTLDQLGVYVYIKDLELRFVYANDKVCRYFGCSPEEIIGFKDTFFRAKPLLITVLLILMCGLIDECLSMVKPLSQWIKTISNRVVKLNIIQQ